jgi:hypothetical protein
MDKITEVQKYIMDQRLSNDQVSIILENINRSFNRALNGIKIDMPEIIKKMNQLSYEDLLSVQTLIFLEGQENSLLRKKKEGTLKLISKEIEDIDYECSQCKVEVKDHLTIANKSQEELLKLDNKIGGSISWRLYDKISNNEALQTYQEENNKKDEIEHVTIGEYDDVNDNSELQKVTNALIAMCKSDVYKDIFGGLCNGQPLEMKTNSIGKNIGHLADYELEHIINKYVKLEMYHIVKFEELELKLRRQFYKIFDCNSVSYYIDQKIKDKQQLLNFGRGKNIAWPLAAIVALKEKQAELSDESEEISEYKELLSICRSDEYKDIFGNLIISDPLAITLNETALNLAQKSDSSLQKIIDRCTDGEKDSLVKYEKLELRLRKQFYEIYQGESVKGILFRCIKDRHSLNRFGRGRVIVWPLEVVYRLHQKEKEFFQNKTEEVKEIPDNDMVNKPKHYMFNVDGHDVQAIDLVKGLLTPEEFRGWIKGSYFTYLMRADRKNGIEDLEKARTFLNWQIQLDKGEELTLPGKK